MTTRHLGRGLPTGAVPLLFLAITAFTLSRLTLALLADPEGPNLFVVAVFGMMILPPSLVGYRSALIPALSGWKRVAAAVPTQAAAATVAYLALR